MALKIGGKSDPPKETPQVEAPKAEKKDPKKPTSNGNGNNLAAILAAIQKDKGDKVAVTANRIPQVRRLPTGIFEVDFYLGGGFPRGRYSIIYGPESSCKTNIALKLAAQAQRLPEPCNKVVWVDVEHAFDPVWAQKMGVDVTKLIVVQPGYGEEAVDLIDALVRGDDVALLIVDSVAPLIASKEIAQSAEKFDVGTSALLIKRMVNKLMVAFAEQGRKGLDPCVILINQTRFKVGVMFGDPETMPGGEAQKFLSVLRVRLYGKNIIEKATNTVVAKDVHAVVKKAKVLVRAASFDFVLATAPHNDLQIGETDSFNTVKGHLQALGLLVKTPAGYQVKMPKVQTFPTLTAMQDRYQKDHKFQLELQQLVINSYGEETMLMVEDIDPTAKDATPGVVQSIAENPDANTL